MLAWLASIALTTPLVILDPGHGGEELGASKVLWPTREECLPWISGVV